MKGIDCNTKLTASTASAIKNAGYEFVIRYVGRNSQASFDIDSKEITAILSAGLKFGIVQHCPPKPGIIPSKDLGAKWGKNAVTFAKAAGYKSGCIIYLDLEDVNADYRSRKQDIIDFCNAWYAEVNAAGYVPGIYVGFNVWLNGTELYSLKFQHYWKSLSSVPAIPNRGYEMVQRAGDPVAGISVDVNTVTGDLKGNFPVFMSQSVEQLTWLEIIRKYTDNPEAWEKAVNASVAAASAGSDWGDLEQLKYLPELIEKIHSK